MLYKCILHRAKHLLGLCRRNVMPCFYVFVVWKRTCSKHQVQVESLYYSPSIDHYSAICAFTSYLDHDAIEHLIFPYISDCLGIFGWQKKHVFFTISWKSSSFFFRHLQWNPFSFEKKKLWSPWCPTLTWIDCFPVLLYNWYSGHCFHHRVVPYFSCRWCLMGI